MENQEKDELLEALTELEGEKGIRIGAAILDLQKLHQKQIKELAAFIDRAYEKGYDDAKKGLPKWGPPKLS